MKLRQDLISALAPPTEANNVVGANLNAANSNQGGQ